MKKKNLMLASITILVLLIGFCLYYFVIPTTTYYKIIIMPDSMARMFGDYSPDVDVYKTYSSGDWDETLEHHRLQGIYTKERQNEEYNNHIKYNDFYEGIDGKGLALKDIAKSHAILVSIKHTRNLDVKKLLEDVEDVGDARIIGRKHDLEIRAAYIY